jgi:hypothetical protein
MYIVEEAAVWETLTVHVEPAPEPEMFAVIVVLAATFVPKRSCPTAIVPDVTVPTVRVVRLIEDEAI